MRLGALIATEDATLMSMVIGNRQVMQSRQTFMSQKHNSKGSTPFLPTNVVSTQSVPFIILRDHVGAVLEPGDTYTLTVKIDVLGTCRIDSWELVPIGVNIDNLHVIQDGDEVIGDQTNMLVAICKQVTTSKEKCELCEFRFKCYTE